MRDKNSDEVKKLLEQLGFEVDSVLDAKVEKRPRSTRHQRRYDDVR